MPYSWDAQLSHEMSSSCVICVLGAVFNISEIFVVLSKGVQTCFAFGEPHYITYDGKFITYQGTCRYVLTKYEKEDSGLTPFAVYVKNEHRIQDKSISYPSYIEAEVFGYRIRLGRNNVVLVTSGNEVRPSLLMMLL